jgi:hypothetical protein
MKKTVLAAAVALLFLSPSMVRADNESAEAELTKAEQHITDAASYARRSYSAGVLEEAQFNARKSEEAAMKALSAVQNAKLNAD